MSQFSIHLSEPLSEAEAKRVAQATAPALGGSPEKLQLLLSRQKGSRIARASNQRQADTVANILRGAGVKVDVLENAADVEVAGPSAAAPAGLPASPDPFAEPGIPPLNPAVEPSKTDPFAAPKSDPFAAPQSDPFAAPKSDPFAPPSSPIVTGRTMSVPAKPDAPSDYKSDPFAAPKSDPFAAPKSDPFAAPKSDPFAAPLASRATVETSLSPDPFAAPGTNLVIDQKTQQFDLPSQARQARDRAMPRSSVRNQMLLSLIIPYVLVAVAAIAFMLYQLPQIYRAELGQRAYQAALAQAESSQTMVAQLPAPEAIKTLQDKAKTDLVQMPGSTAIIYAAPVMQISGTNGEVAALASQVSMTPEEARALDTDLKELKNQSKPFGVISFRGEQFVASVAEVKSKGADVQVIGDVHVLFSLSEIWNQVVQGIVPLLVALGIIFVLSLFLANALAARLSRPIIAATDQANRIALGDLDRSVTVESNDEIGDMLGSLERMRVSLKSMVARLRRNT